MSILVILYLVPAYTRLRAGSGAEAGAKGSYLVTVTKGFVERYRR